MGYSLSPSEGVKGLATLPNLLRTRLSFRPIIIATSYEHPPNKVLAGIIRMREVMFHTKEHKCMNAELVKQAMEKVKDPYVLVNLVSRRVRQLNAGAGEISRPLIADAGSLGVADIALREIIEDKMGFEIPEFVKLIRPSAQRRNRPQGWIKSNPAVHKLAA